MCLTAIVIIPSDFEVEATPGGGEGGDNGSIGLNYTYIWEITQKLCNVIYDAYEPGDIPRGRFFGSKGGNYTVYQILKPEMNAMDLENVTELQISDLPDTDKNYTTMIWVNDFKLTVNNDNYPFPNTIPITELFPVLSRHHHTIHRS